jgi:hypothetical protein
MQDHFPGQIGDGKYPELLQTCVIIFLGLQVEGAHIQVRRIGIDPMLTPAGNPGGVPGRQQKMMLICLQVQHPIFRVKQLVSKMGVPGCMKATDP